MFFSLRACPFEPNANTNVWGSFSPMALALSSCQSLDCSSLSFFFPLHLYSFSLSLFVVPLILSLALPHTELLSIFLPSLFPLLLFPFLFSPQGYMSSHSLSLSLIPCFCSILYYSHALALFLLSRSSLSARTWFMALETSQKCCHGLIVGHAVC